MELDKWLSLMEKNGQADIPMDFDGTIMTPREFVTLAKRGEVTLVMAEAPSNVFTMQELLKTRFRDRYNEGKVEGVYRCNPDGAEFYYSPEQQMEEVNNISYANVRKLDDIRSGRYSPSQEAAHEMVVTQKMKNWLQSKYKA